MKNKYQIITLLLILSAHVTLLGQQERDAPMAAGKDKFLGNIYSSSQAPDFTAYWNQVTPENAGKWGSVESSRDNMNWNALDAAYALAKDNDFPFRFHVLIWGNQQPGWIESLEPAEQLEEIEEWFAAVAERYPDIDYLEVVNEPIHDRPAGEGNGNYINALGGAGESGYDWIINSFKLAREHFPDTPLMINEYNIIGDASKTTRYVKIVNLLQDEDLIDLIGFQGHAFSTQYAEASAIANNLNTLAATGLPLMVTEMDIDGETDAVQLAEYKRVFPLFWEHQAIVGVTLWGWKRGMWRTNEGAFLVNSDGTDRPAFTWLQTYVAESNVVTAVDTRMFEMLSIYPNPVTSGRFRVKGTHQFTKLKVLDMQGNRLKETDISKSMGQAEQAFFEVELNVAPGLYMIQLSNGRNSSFKKLMVR